MATVTLATTLSKWLPDPVARGGGEWSSQFEADNVRALLDQLFALHPVLRGYVLEDHGALRHHVAIFVDGVAVGDKKNLRHPLSSHTEVFIAQALSGG